MSPHERECPLSEACPAWIHGHRVTLVRCCHCGRECICKALHTHGERLAAAHDRIVAEAEARGWNAAVEAASETVDGGFTTLANDPEVDQVGRDLVHAYLAGALDAIAALRKPEVEG